MTPTNETEETHDTAEDLYNENLDEQVRVRSVCEGSGRTRDANGDTT